MKLTACWIVKDEAEDLARSIASVAHVADELVVVATAPSRQVVQVAEAAGARVEHFAWTGDFAAARNFALGFATGDAVVFLDADEWFAPALTEGEKTEIQNIFAAGQTDAIQVRLTNVDAVTMAVISQENVVRIFSNRRQLRYAGAIHERPVGPGGRALVAARTRWNLNHTGYSAEGVQHKMKRNIAMLEKALENKGLSAEDLALNLTYLVREYNNAGQYNKALQALNRLLAVPGTAQFWADGPNFATLVLYNGMQAAANARQLASRQMLKSRLLQKMQKALPREPSVGIAPLHFSLLFVQREDQYLEEVARLAPPATAAAKHPEDANYLKHLSTAHIAAAAIWRRWQNRAAAFDYLLAAFTQTGDLFVAQGVHLLLWAVQGQPTADQIMLLERLFDLENQHKLEWLLKQLRFETTLDLYLYFFKKQLDRGWAKKTDFFFVQMLQGQYAELLENLRAAQAEMPAPEWGATVLLAGVCANDARFAELLQNSKRREKTLLEAFFRQEPLRAPTRQDLEILEQNYGLMQAAQPAMAERFRALYAQAPRESLLCFANHCAGAQRWRELQEALESNPEPYLQDAPIMGLYLYALVETGEGEKALALARRLIEEGLADTEIFAGLLALAQTGGGAPGREAAALYAQQRPLYEEYVDMCDVANTGYVEEEFSKKQIRALAALSLEELDRSLAQDAFATEVPRYQKALAAAAAVYEEKGMPAMAQHCLRRALAGAGAPPGLWGPLARCFEALGNGALAAQLQQRAEQE